MHRLKNIDELRREADCSICGRIDIRKHGERDGKTRWRCGEYIRSEDRKRKRKRPLHNKKHIRFRTNVCSDCGFSDDDQRLFDVHHKDGNHKNNDPSNLETLCPICHRRHHLKRMDDG